MVDEHEATLNLSDTYRSRIQAYFDAIDDGRVEDAIERLHPEVTWSHMQVWQADPDQPTHRRTHQGREAVASVLRAYQQSSEADRNVSHEVREILVDGDRCAFLGAVVGPERTFPMFGWVTFDDELIRRYVAGPRP